MNVNLLINTYIISHRASDIQSLHNRLLAVEGQLAKMGASAFQSSLFREALLRDPRLSPTIAAIWRNQLILLQDFLARMPLQVILQPTSVRLNTDNANIPSEYPAALIYLPTAICNFPNPPNLTLSPPLHSSLSTQREHESLRDSRTEINPYYEWNDRANPDMGGVEMGRSFMGERSYVGGYANTDPATSFTGPISG